ncbi:MAG: hypothetical protein H6739_32155 [Alphaproteobacteria bacterium]|nr:hypothetical protein [Alphaproteobacteria bacterium]
MLLLLLACTGGSTPDDLPTCHDAVTVDVSLCDPDTASFTLGSTNPWYPLVVGSRVELEGEEDGIAMRVERTVLEETRAVLGVEVHVLEHKTFHDGEIHEVAYNFYVEADDGTVCYFGEDVEFYEGGALANTDGTWRAGEGDGRPGVIMPADPQVGDVYYQEMAPGQALDMGEITDTALTLDFGDASYDLIQVMDTNPIDDEEPCAPEEKRYARGIGEVRDVALDIVAFEPGG